MDISRAERKHDLDSEVLSEQLVVLVEEWNS